MAFTQSQLSELEAAYASGRLSVKWRDASGNSREVTFDSREALRTRIDELRAELGLVKPGLRIGRTQYDKGVR